MDRSIKLLVGGILLLLGALLLQLAVDVGTAGFMTRPERSRLEDMGRDAGILLSGFGVALLLLGTGGLLLGAFRR